MSQLSLSWSYNKGERNLEHKKLDIADERITEEQKKAAAYALNMCTVSVRKEIR